MAGIYVGDEQIDPVLRVWMPGLSDPNLGYLINQPPSAVYVGDELIWPAYREEFHWFEWDTPGYSENASGPFRSWRVELPDWATNIDWVACHPGERGENGTRGFGNNDGYGGRAREIQYGSTGTPQMRFANASISHPVSALGERMPLSTIALSGQSGVFPQVGTQTNITTAGLPRGSGASVPPVTAFGRSWPGGAGGARDQVGQPYGGGGGGGEGGPIIGNPAPRQGMPGGGGYVAWRVRSGPVPDGHTWPQNPDWANPQ